MIEFLSFDKNHHQLQYNGKCKIIINFLTNLLTVKPCEDSDFKIHSTSLKSRFVKEKNILFVFCDPEVLDFALIFKDEICSGKVFNCVKKFEKTLPESLDSLNARFLLPIFTQISNADMANSRVKEIISQWIQNCDSERQKHFMEMMKENNICHNFFSERNLKNKKRKLCDISSTARTLKIIQQSKKFELNLEEYSNIIKSPLFKLMHKQKRGSLRRLIIYTSSTLSTFHEYVWYSKHNAFFCYGCQSQKSRSTAIMGQDSEGNVHVKTDESKHICKSLTQIPENYVEIEILRKPKYEILEGGANRSRKLLIIFDENDRNLCYEFYWAVHSSHFLCLGCKNLRTKAYLRNEGQKNEYLEIFNTHVCQKRKYQTDKFFGFKDVVLKPDYEVCNTFHRGKTTKLLIIFRDNEKKKCLKYHFDNTLNVFVCAGCQAMTKYVSAKLQTNRDGEEYALLCSTKHGCSPIKYDSIENFMTVEIEKSKYVLNETILNGISKLFIFSTDKNDASLGHGFRLSEQQNVYHCKICDEKAVAYIIKKEGNFSIQIPKNQKHCCKPHKFNPTLFQSPKFASAFALCEPEEQTTTSKVVIYHPDNRNLGYLFVSSKSQHCFKCFECKKKGKTTAAKFEFNRNKELHFLHDPHICDPIIVETQDFKFLDSANYDSLFLVKSLYSVSENQILDSSKFELLSQTCGRTGAPQLMIYASENRKMTFSNFNFCEKTQNYYCQKCKAAGDSVTVTIFTDLKNCKFAILDGKKHVCKATPMTLINSTDFVVIRPSGRFQTTKLFTFTSASREECYEYTFQKSARYFHCIGCFAMNKSSYAKLLINPNGEEFVQQLKKGHSCKPKKYIPEKWHPKTVPKPLFQLLANRTDGEGKRLIVFLTEEKDTVYEYYWYKENYYACSKCRKKQKNVTARVFEDQVELSPNLHICTPRPYEAEKYRDKDTVESTNFHVHSNIRGVPESRLTIINPENKDMGYEYGWEKDKKAFVCLGCSRMKKKYISAKISEDKNGSAILLLGKRAHFCEERNLRKKGLIIEGHEFKISTKNNAQIICATPATYKKAKFQFIFDEKHGTFCCSKCQEKKWNVTAKICKNKNGKEFLLQNDKHKCVPLPRIRNV